MGNAAYRKVLAGKVGKEPPVFVKALAWLFMGALYVCETAGPAPAPGQRHAR